jgi:energy-coupling factor transport system permease protein
MRSAGGASPLRGARASLAAAWCAALIAAAVSVGQPLALGALVAAVFAAASAAGVPRPVLRSLRFSLPMAVLIVVINALVSRDGLTVLARLGDAGPLGQLDVTLEAVSFGAFQGLVLIAVVAVCALGAAAIDPDEILRSMRRLSFRSALTATIATRMVPLLAADARRIGEAQRCRPHPGGRLSVMRAITANALDRSLDIAATLEVRGYGAARRPARRPRPLSRHDIAFACSGVAVLVAAFALRPGFRFYPSLRGSLDATPALWLGAALALAVLVPFAQRRGVER